MRLPQPLLESPFFLFSSLDEIAAALANSPTLNEIEDIRRLAEAGLPPITSIDALAVMIGINPGIIWSFINRTNRHYRVFEIPKGKGKRTIASPRVGLKVVQTWMGYHLSRAISLPPHVYGFVRGLSHIDAAFQHQGAEWAYSVDIKDFFGTTSAKSVASSLIDIGYNDVGALLVARLSALNGFLAQGSPASPVLSNIAFLEMDGALAALASRYRARLTRYADDIVFSGFGQLPDGLIQDVKALFEKSLWTLAANKEQIEPIKGRIKVHGLIVNGPKVRLTKGYRNKIRAYRHVLNKGGDLKNASSLKGHVGYSDHVTKRLAILSDGSPVHKKVTPIVPPDISHKSKPKYTDSLFLRVAHRLRDLFEKSD